MKSGNQKLLFLLLSLHRAANHERVRLDPWTVVVDGGILFIRRVVYPYTFHFKAVNTHLLLETPLSGDPKGDREKVFQALENGHAFIGYDLPASTKGFRFEAQGKDQRAMIGDRVSAHMGVTMQIKLPLKTECLLKKDGQVVKTWRKKTTITYITAEPGVYRVEAFLRYRGKRRAWIFSNPIYVVK